MDEKATHHFKAVGLLVAQLLWYDDLKSIGLFEEHRRQSIAGYSGQYCPLISSKMSYY